ncbi:hypothetical protein AXF42_Ash011441 [Apostasia shenzhenica]|uniref:Histone chaperone domain-containing protein n=1 Tax=Apostasia shenzhenica TaxID=1088818 RepID=A0A2I0AEI2_9ASPA|nr:hypothetical protein AXF42_Ash011441 [Apostasia shenzhenica]
MSQYLSILPLNWIFYFSFSRSRKLWEVRFIGSEYNKAKISMMKVNKANCGNSLTLEGVRRALEKELGMEIFSLDVHKGFIKHCFEECFDGGDDVSLTTPIVSTSDRDLPMVNKETSGEKDQQDHKSSGSDPNEKAEESTAGEVANGKSTKAQDLDSAYNVTLGKVRRLLEEDFNLETNTLDAYKSFISDVIDEVLQAPETAENTNGGMDSMEVSIKSLAKQISRKRKESKVVAAEGSESLNLDEKNEDDEDVEDEMPKKRPRQKSQSITKDMKKHKKTLGVNKTSGSRKKKSENLDLGKSSENEDDKSAEDDKLPSSSDERSKKKQEKPTTQVYGKHLEHLKSIIKACGMSVPPSVYKRAKQAPEKKRVAALIKELEEILAKEDLSTNPSEKGTYGAYSSVISTTSYIPTPKPKIEVSDEDEDEEDKVDVWTTKKRKVTMMNIMKIMRTVITEVETLAKEQKKVLMMRVIRAWGAL